MPMTDELPRAGTVRSEAEPMDDVIQPALHQAQQHFARVFRRARRNLEIAAKLAFESAVEALQFLLLAQTDAILTRLAAAAAMHAGRRPFTLNGALGTKAPLRLEVQLDALTAAHFADRVDITCHVWLLILSKPTDS